MAGYSVALRVTNVLLLFSETVGSTVLKTRVNSTVETNSFLSFLQYIYLSLLDSFSKTKYRICSTSTFGLLYTLLKSTSFYRPLVIFRLIWMAPQVRLRFVKPRYTLRGERTQL